MGASPLAGKYPNAGFSRVLSEIYQEIWEGAGDSLLRSDLITSGFVNHQYATGARHKGNLVNALMHMEQFPILYSNWTEIMDKKNFRLYSVIIPKLWLNH
jgi:hypothetical protein